MSFIWDERMMFEYDMILNNFCGLNCKPNSHLHVNSRIINSIGFDYVSVSLNIWCDFVRQHIWVSSMLANIHNHSPVPLYFSLSSGFVFITLRKKQLTIKFKSRMILLSSKLFFFFAKQLNRWWILENWYIRRS